MNKRLRSFMWMITIFLLAGNLIPAGTYCQSPSTRHYNNKDIIPAQTLETLRAIYESKLYPLPKFLWTSYFQSCEIISSHKKPCHAP